MQRVFQQSYHVTGTLGANVTITFTAPFDCQLIHISACGSNANSGLLIAGDSGDTNEYLESASIGDSGTPVEFDLDDFVNDQYPHIANGDIVVFTLDYDGASGTATQDFTLVATFTEG